MKFAHFVVAAAFAVVLSTGLEAQAGIFGLCKKDACCEPEPTCCEPEPTCCEPAPGCEPEPVCCEPAPVCEPEPVCCEPEPTCCEPAPCCEPDPCCEPAKKRCGLFSRLKARWAARKCGGC